MATVSTKAEKVWFMVLGEKGAGRETLRVCWVVSCLGWKANAKGKSSLE